MYYASLNEAWLATLNEVMLSSDSVEVRGTRSHELLGHSIEFPMSYAMLNIKERELSYDFMFREAWWILSGKNELHWLEQFAPSYKKFSDDGIRLSGAYGPKIVDQIRYVVDTLQDDPYSRQAVMNIWRENPRRSRDVPCTLSVQFLIRDGAIHTVVNMRSSDVWLGLPYDVFTFTMLTCQVALEIGRALRLGKMFHNAGSRHVYDRNHADAKSICRMYQKFHHDPSDEINLPMLHNFIGSTTAFHQLLFDRSLRKVPEPLFHKLPWLQ